MVFKDVMRLILPPIAVIIGKKLLGVKRTNNNRLFGNFDSWDKAKAASTGYDSEIILEKTRDALLKIKNGEAVYERDSVLFNEIEYSWPLLSGLMWVAGRNKGTLNVLDFGGSLGSTYFQNRFFLSSLPNVRWNIIEQARHVEIGKQWFEDDILHFYPTISECLMNTQPNVLLLGGVLQYLERPYSVLDQALETSCDTIIIDRTPFWEGLTDRICVQEVSPEIYPGSYPSWIFSRSKFHSYICKNWKIIATFDDPDQLAGPIDFSYQGATLVRNTHIS